MNEMKKRPREKSIKKLCFLAAGNGNEVLNSEKTRIQSVSLIKDIQ